MSEHRGLPNREEILTGLSNTLEPPDDYYSALEVMSSHVQYYNNAAYTFASLFPAAPSLHRGMPRSGSCPTFQLSLARCFVRLRNSTCWTRTA